MEKIKKLKKIFKREKIDGYIIPKNDEFFGEYVPEYNDRLNFISNFTGSYGFALEEERRLAYVGITRAKKEAYLSFAMKRAYHGDWMDALPSRFINEIPDESVEKNETL